MRTLGRSGIAGHSERILGRALAGRRDGVVIATKFASVFDEDEGVHYDDRDLPLTYEAIREACEGSLRRLQTDQIAALRSVLAR